MFDDLRAVTLDEPNRTLLIERRKKQKISQKKLATAGRVTQGSIARIEGGTLNPKYCVLERICERLGLSLAVDQVVTIKPFRQAKKKPEDSPNGTV